MQYPRSQWRLLHTPPAPGPWNMAVDEAILESVGRGESLPTLRLYAWSPPCLSIGYAQSLADVDEDNLAALGWGLVRRPTGGRAILHTGELTYSVIAPHAEPRLAGDIPESYRRLSGALLAALQALGLNPQTAEKNAGLEGPQGPVCFEVPSSFEITFQGKKLVGSAQARRGDGILQHGTLPLEGDLGRITQALNYEGESRRTEAAARVRERAATLSEALAKPVTWKQAAGALRRSFETHLNLEFISGELTETELKRAEELVLEKYTDAAWISRV